MHVYIYISMSAMLSAPGATRGGGGGLGGASACSRWCPTSYMDAAFVLQAHKGLEIRTNRSLLFTQVGLLQLQHD